MGSCAKQAAHCWERADEARLKQTLRWLALAVLLLGLGMAVWLNVLQRLPLNWLTRCSA